MVTPIHSRPSVVSAIGSGIEGPALGDEPLGDESRDRGRMTPCADDRTVNRSPPPRAPARRTLSESPGLFRRYSVRVLEVERGALVGAELGQRYDGRPPEQVHDLGLSPPQFGPDLLGNSIGRAKEDTASIRP